MEYNINPNAYKNIFAVPTSLIDENIRLAGVVQLKVILYLLRHINDGDISIQNIADALGLDKFDVSDALVFWQERGIISKNQTEEFSIFTQENVKNFSSSAANVTNTTVPAEFITPQSSENLQQTANVSQQESQNAEIPAVIAPPKAEKKVVSAIPISRPSHQDVVNRLAECDDLKILFQEAQNILGKTIGFDGQSVLLLMYDSYGLSVEVIMMVIQYCVEMGKASFSNIAKMARIWAEQEIFTIELASEFIEENGQLEEVWRKFIGLAGLTNRQPTTKQKQHFSSWVKEFGYDADMIYYAYEENVDHTGKMSLPYMDKIIRNWSKNNVKTPMDIQREKQKWLVKKESTYAKNNSNQAKTKASTQKAEPETSYDIDEYMKKSIGLKYVKNED